ncbi:helix-turn-helix domain-containing protein [Sphaerisporangium sp. TRM90804]|uniref:helix-turn-helix domain-containing protein n=1 Tax=Sphaerisporangium sp. TRM90804 TaxID=3031113 RepID=UPI00244A7DE5|nr:helix-turn-helix domain-containing protein [Sphaerisporangium sp. TRM90804]MDH2427975.1 helix-turn-helix domain-containing protein [Sphaerisporangium sp. TRM90804]
MRTGDVAALKAFAHPLRIRLYYALRNARAASVSYLANSVEAPVAQVSYHLHQLNQHGFIEQAPQYARDGRERWWQLSEKRLGWDDSSLLDEPEAAAVAATVKGSALTEQFRIIRDFHAEDDREWDPAWLDAAFMTDGIIDLTHDELSRMNAELMSVVDRYAALGAKWRQTSRTATRPGAERVMYVLHGFPVRRTWKTDGGARR